MKSGQDSCPVFLIHQQLYREFLKTQGQCKNGESCFRYRGQSRVMDVVTVRIPPHSPQPVERRGEHPVEPPDFS